MDKSIKLIVGLGNPGSQYENTRHNAGVWLVKAVAEKYEVSLKFESKFKGFVGKVVVNGCECALLLPQTFMNLSGESVSNMVNFYKIDVDSILVVHDELDFLPGTVRFKKGGGINGHNGLRSIVEQLGDKDFWRLRIGIGKPKFKDDMSGYVLSAPKKAENERIEDAIIRVVATISQIISGDFSKAMMELH